MCSRITRWNDQEIREELCEIFNVAMWKKCWFLLFLWVFLDMTGLSLGSGRAPALTEKDNQSGYQETVDANDEQTGEQLVAVRTLSKSSQNAERASVKSSARDRRAVTAIKYRVWPNAIIPYVLGDNVTAEVRQNINLAIAQWQKHTCIRFVNRTKQPDYIIFNPGACGCCSFVGRRGGGQEVSLSPHCAMYGVVLHELGHVVGFWHEHSRPDRDKYISIVNENIIFEKLENFAKKPTSDIDSLGQPYDYQSIMHYRKNTFSKNHKNTILPTKYGVYIGQRERLSAGDILQTNLLYNCPKPVCHQEFTDQEGTFQTPNYPYNYYKDHQCTWVIHLKQGEEVVLEFDEFDLETSDNCSFDFIEVREGIDNTGPLVGRLCGHGFPGEFQSHSSLWIKFISDKSFARKGFRAQYKKTQDTRPVPPAGSGYWEGSSSSKSGQGSYIPQTMYRAACNLHMQQSRGDLLTPLIPILYKGAPIQCSWMIDGGSKSSQILLEIHPSEGGVRTEHCIGRVYQRKTQHGARHRSRSGGKTINHISNKAARDNHTTHRLQSVRYNCHTSRHIVVDSTGVIIQWSSHQYPAFMASYKIDYDECVLKTSKCDHYCHNTADSYQCSCKTGYLLHPGGYKCIPKTVDVLDRCGGNLTGDRGKLRAGSEPLEDCYFYIYHQDHSRIQLTFTKFAVPSKTNVNGTCLHSYVEVLSGKALTSKGRFCGMKRPPIITSSSSVLVIKTHTNLHRVFMMPYFSAKYVVTQSQNAQADCFYKLRAHGTVITSPDFPNPYHPDTFCVWRISARKGEQIQIIFDSMDIEQTKLCSFDYVEVFDGKHVSANLLGRFCGRGVPWPITSTGKHIRILFVTDGSGSGRGFQAHFNVIS